MSARSSRQRAQEQHAGAPPVDRERDRGDRPDVRRRVLRAAPGRGRAWRTAGVPRPSVDQQRLVPTASAVADLRVSRRGGSRPRTVHVLRRGERARRLAGAGQHDRAMRDARATRAMRRASNAIDLRRRQLAGDLVQDLDEPPIVRRVLAHALQLGGGVVKRRSGRAELVAGAKLRAHAARAARRRGTACSRNRRRPTAARSRRRCPAGQGVVTTTRTSCHRSSARRSPSSTSPSALRDARRRAG